MRSIDSAIAAFLVAGALAFPSGLAGQVTFLVGDAQSPPDGSRSVPLSILIRDDTAVTSWCAVIRYDPAVIAGVSFEHFREADFITFLGPDFFSDPGTVAFGAIYDGTGGHPDRALTASDCGDVGRIRFCVRDDAPSGTFPIAPIEGAGTGGMEEPVGTTYRASTGARDLPLLEPGSITVEGVVLPGIPCGPSGYSPDEAIFALGRITAAPGAVVRIPLEVHLLAPGASMERWSIPIRFDPAIVERIWIETDRPAEIFSTLGPESFHEPGTIAVEAVYDETGEQPYGEVAAVRICLRPDAPRGPHPLQFLERAETAGGDLVFRYPSFMASPGSISIEGEPVPPVDCPDPLPDTRATFALERVTAAPGAKDVSVPVSLTLAEGLEVTAYCAVVAFDPSIIEGIRVEDARGSERFTVVRPARFSEPGRIGLVALFDASPPYDSLPMTSEDDGTVARIRICLRPGAPPGDYPLSFLPQEPGMEAHLLLPSGYSRIGLAFETGTLSIAGDPAAPAECPFETEPEEPVEPELRATFRLGETAGSPGGEVRVPFTVQGSREVGSFLFSIDFDEGILECEEVEAVYRQPDGREADFQDFRYDNSDLTPGNGGIDEGYVTGAMVFSLRDKSIFLPPGVETEVLAFHFRIEEDAFEESTELRFLDGAWPPDLQPIENIATIRRTSVIPSGEAAMVLLNGRMTIQPDIAIFVRGDGGGDGVVDLSDPIYTLGFLFLGGPLPACPDAADANDDGVLDISDPLATLAFLFLGEGHLHLGVRDRDRTPDRLGCSY